MICVSEREKSAIFPFHSHISCTTRFILLALSRFDKADFGQLCLFSCQVPALNLGESCFLQEFRLILNAAIPGAGMHRSLGLALRSSSIDDQHASAGLEHASDFYQSSTLHVIR